MRPLDILHKFLETLEYNFGEPYKLEDFDYTRYLDDEQKWLKIVRLGSTLDFYTGAKIGMAGDSLKNLTPGSNIRITNIGLFYLEDYRTKRRAISALEKIAGKLD